MMKKVEGTPQPLGATTYHGYTNFAVSVPAGKTCRLLVYQKGKTEPVQAFDMPEEEGLGEVRFLALEGFRADRQEYNFEIDKQVCVDPYVREVARTKRFGEKPDPQKHEIRGRVPETEYDWEQDHHLKLPLNEVVAYSLHVRGFTKHSSSKVKHKGTFLGVIEKIPYLKALGINQIQCMPIYEFAEIVGTRTNYWGYGKGYYFAPKPSYSASGYACRELKDMVKACHKAGIEVVAEMPFTPEILPQMAVECLKYYMLEYHMDGFVVNPYNAPWESMKQDPLLKGIKLIQKDDGFQNVVRRFLKGDEGMIPDVIWAIKHNTTEDNKYNYVTNQTGFTLQDLVSYDAKHNEENGEHNQDGPDYNYSWNCGAEGPSRKKAIVELRKKQIRNAFMLLLLSQGTPCLLAGDEFGNTQKGNNNVYCQDNETAWLNWNKIKTNESLLQYVKTLIAFRKEHVSLHKKAPLLGMDKTACGLPDVSFHGEAAWQTPAEVYSRQLGVMYCDDEEKQDTCYVAYNMHWLKHTFALPSLPKGKKWYRVMDTAKEQCEEKLEEMQKAIRLNERSIVVLCGK